MLGREHRVGHPEGGVRARREDGDLRIAPADHRQVELGPLAPADPVSLHRHDALRPAGQPIAPVEELLGVVRDLEEPALDLLRQHLGVAAPAAPALDLLVGQDGLAGRAPVHRGALLVREAPLEHADEDELLPPVVGRDRRWSPRDPSRTRCPCAGAASRMFSMFSCVHTAGCTPFSMAAFSAGRPKASQPIGCRTLNPRIHLNRARRSPIA